ncbi:MAG: hypothetical protein WBL74_01375 [Novosphingobium sp.]|uniref:hypothetical protein n=1 Tax=Novosphingobium sp. TaxID=1874826 RepID=UPI003C7C2C91
MKRAFVLALLLLTACSKKAEPQPGATATGDPAAISSDAAAANTPVVIAGPASRYTSFKDCKPVKSGESLGEDWSVSRCAGLGGYDLLLNYGDARDDLALLHKGSPAVELGLIGLSGGGFSSLADKAEWRGLGSGAVFAPTALIVRDLISEDPGNAERQTAVLMVIDLRQHCVTAKVRPQAGQNEAARAIADAPSRKCLR